MCAVGIKTRLSYRLSGKFIAILYAGCGKHDTLCGSKKC